VVRLVRDRDRWQCVRCGTTESLTTQHRVARGMGGTRWLGVNLPANLITLCGSGTTGCHGWVERHPTEAKLLGLALSRFISDPASHPVFTWRGWLRLHDDGSTQECVPA
jgi:hypothetical protein